MNGMRPGRRDVAMALIATSSARRTPPGQSLSQRKRRASDTERDARQGGSIRDYLPSLAAPRGTTTMTRRAVLYEDNGSVAAAIGG